jgi:hypothetical protein
MRFTSRFGKDDNAFGEARFYSGGRLRFCSRQVLFHAYTLKARAEVPILHPCLTRNGEHDVKYSGITELALRHEKDECSATSPGR